MSQEGVQENGLVWLLWNASATGNWHHWPGGRGQFGVGGNFSGATVALERQGVEPGKELPMGTDTNITIDGVANFEAPPCLIRASVTGGTSPTGLYAQAYRIPAAL